MSSSIVPYTLKILNSHIEVTFHPPIVDGTWAEIDDLGNNVVQEIENRKQPSCLIDLSELTYMGSSIVALMVRVWKEVKSNNGKMVIVTDHPLVREIITLAGLDKIWSLYPNINSARKAIGAPPVQDGSNSSATSQSSKGKLLLILVVLAVAGFGVAYFMNQTQ